MVDTCLRPISSRASQYHSLLQPSFAPVEEMDAAILANLNKLVGANGRALLSGRFCLGGPDQARQYRDRIICRNIHVVEGNHDAALRNLTGAFSSSNQLVKVRVGGQRIVLCHYAMRVWHHSGRGVWHLNGYSNGINGRAIHGQGLVSGPWAEHLHADSHAT
jgi:calcineurin-like phosphoesterase family protein